MNKLNKTLDSGYDIFNLNSEFFNDICRTKILELQVSQLMFKNIILNNENIKFKFC